MTEDRVDENAGTGESASESSSESETATATATQDQPQYGVGPFSVREVALVGVWLVAFVVSFFGIAGDQSLAQLLFGGSVWTNGLDWILTIGVPTVAVFLVVLRRFSPDGIRRVGSLGIDQFASVAFSVSTVVWLTLLWRNIAVAIETSVWIYGWVLWVEFFLMLAGVVLTVLAPFIPTLGEDFTGRREIVAHRNARPIRAVSPRPARPAPEPRPEFSDDTAVLAAPTVTSDTFPVPTHGEPTIAGTNTGELGAWAPAQTRDTFERVEAAAPQPSYQAFWALAPEERDVVDDRGVPIFRVGPTAWTLVLEDRGEVFVVRHEDGSVGYLHDVSGVTRG